MISASVGALGAQTSHAQTIPAPQTVAADITASPATVTYGLPNGYHTITTDQAFSSQTAVSSQTAAFATRSASSGVADSATNASHAMTSDTASSSQSADMASSAGSASYSAHAAISAFAVQAGNTAQVQGVTLLDAAGRIVSTALNGGTYVIRNNGSAAQADGATTAGFATASGHSATSDVATSATNALNAQFATTSGHSTSSDTATASLTSQTAQSAVNAQFATASGHSTSSDTATASLTSGYAAASGTAQSALVAQSAQTAVLAQMATNAAHATTSDTAAYANSIPAILLPQGGSAAYTISASGSSNVCYNTTGLSPNFCSITATPTLLPGWGTYSYSFSYTSTTEQIAQFVFFADDGGTGLGEQDMLIRDDGIIINHNDNIPLHAGEFHHYYLTSQVGSSVVDATSHYFDTRFGSSFLSSSFQYEIRTIPIK